MSSPASTFGRRQVSAWVAAAQRAFVGSSALIQLGEQYVEVALHWPTQPGKIDLSQGLVSLLPLAFEAERRSVVEIAVDKYNSR